MEWHVFRTINLFLCATLLICHVRTNWQFGRDAKAYLDADQVITRPERDTSLGKLVFGQRGNIQMVHLNIPEIGNQIRKGIRNVIKSIANPISTEVITELVVDQNGYEGDQQTVYVQNPTSYDVYKQVNQDGFSSQPQNSYSPTPLNAPSSASPPYGPPGHPPPPPGHYPAPPPGHYPPPPPGHYPRPPGHYPPSPPGHYPAPPPGHHPPPPPGQYPAPPGYYPPPPPGYYPPSRPPPGHYPPPPYGHHPPPYGPPPPSPPSDLSYSYDYGQSNENSHSGEERRNFSSQPNYPNGNTANQDQHLYLSSHGDHNGETAEGNQYALDLDQDTSDRKRENNIAGYIDNFPVILLKENEIR